MNNIKLINNFLRYLTEKGVSINSLKYYKSDIVNFLKWKGQREISNSLVKEYLNSIKFVTPNSTINRRLSTLRSYSQFVNNNFMEGIENVGFKFNVSQTETKTSFQQSIYNKLSLLFKKSQKLQNLTYKVFFSRPNWYKKYHSYPIANYIHIAILILFSSLSGYAVYDQVFYSTDRSLAYPTALERPNRYLSFQGRLTDDLGNPETTATNMVFKLYDVSTGGTALWDSGTCSITPDQDGIFSTLLGSSCGSEIASSVFSENAEVWLGVTVGADAEATPRIQIATVAYALNSETLQGFPAGTGTSTIPYIDSTGKLAIAAASPTIESTSGTFAVTGQAMTISTANTTNGDITINPDGTGSLNLTFEGAAPDGGANGFVNATNANITSGSLYAGTVASAATGYNFINFLAGVSPTSVFSVQNDGDIVTAGDITISGGNINTGNIAFTIGDVTTDSITLTTDGTGNGEVVLPNDSIGPNEIHSTGQTDEYCLTYEATGTTLEWQVCSAGGTMSSFTAAGDSGVNQTINDGNTLSILGGTNGIDTVGSATDILTLNLDTTEIGTTTFGSGSGFTWTFNAGATDPTLAFASDAITLTAATTSLSGDLDLADNNWIGLSSSAGLIEFDDQTIDEVNILNSNVGIGTSTPEHLLDVNGDLGIGDKSGGTYSLYFRDDTGSTTNYPSIKYTDNTSLTLNTRAGEDIIFSDAGVENMRIKANGNVGIGTTGPDAKLDSLATSGEQLRLTYTDGSVYSGFTLDSNGYLVIDPTGGRIALDGSLQVGSTSPLAYSRLGTNTTAHAGNITSSNDLLISSDLEVDGTLFLDGGNVANSAGTATIVLSSDPITTANTLSAGNWFVENTANVGQAALMVNQTKSGDLFTASSSGTPKFTITNSGSVGIGTNLPSQELDVVGDIQLSGLLYDTYVTAGIRLGNINETALTGFGASSIVGALNELKSGDKNTSHNDYLSWANHYKERSEGSNLTDNEALNGLFFDTFVDGTKFDGVNSTSSANLKISDNEYRVGLIGGQTYNSSTSDNDGQTYLGSNTVNDIYYYDRSRDSSPEVLVELGIDPNWYNGVTLSVATSSATYSQAGTLADKNPNLTTSYNGSLIKATGTDSTPRTIYITIKSPTTFDWTNYQGDAATGVTITPGTAQALGSTGVSVTFTAANYNTGDVFKIASWYIEPESSTRGAKQQFPERSYLVGSGSAASTGYLDIIDVDTQKLWMRFDGTNTNNMIQFSTTSVNALNGRIYATNSNATNGRTWPIDFVHDTGFIYYTNGTYIYNGGISQRNSGLYSTVILINNSVSIVSLASNDVDAAVIPNHPTKEVTVSGWGYITISGGVDGFETVNLPYTFNDTPEVTITYNGYSPSGTPSSLENCTNRGTAAFTYSAYVITKNSFRAYFDTNNDGTFAASACYSWTATGTVSPKQFVAVATGATSADGGTTIINETDGTKADTQVGSQSSAALWQSHVAFAGNNLYVASYQDDASDYSYIATYNGIHGLKSETSFAQYRNGYYFGKDGGYKGGAGPSFLATATTHSQIKTLSAVQNTSTNSPDSNTIYIGTTSGVSVINEIEGYGNVADGEVEAGGSVKYYTKDYISEEMIGDIRGMWPLNASNTASDLEDVSLKANTLTATNITSADAVSGVRGEATDFDGSTEYLSRADDSDFDFTATDNFSIGAWVKTSTASTTQVVMNKYDGGNAYWALYLSSTAGVPQLQIRDSSANLVTVNSPLSVNDNQWHHIVGVRDITNDKIHIYVDGNLSASATDSTTTTFANTGSIDIAKQTVGTPYWYTGAIDEAFVTATALTASQVKNMYQVGYRALQSHGTTLGGGSADANQRLGYISTGTNTVGVVQPDFNNQFMYVGLNSTTLGGLSKIQLNSDTNIKTYNSSANVPSGGTLLIDEDVTSLAVGYQLEAVGSAASGVKSMAPDNNAGALTSSLFSKTQTLNSSTKFAYFWTSVYTDSSDSASAINVYACNNYATKALCDSNNAWVLGTLIQTDTTQSTPEREYHFSFPNAGSNLTFKIDFKRTDNKANTYIERYGASWSSSVGGADIAERYESSEPVYPGDVVTIDSPVKDGTATVKLSSLAYDQKVIGVVTTNPGIVMDENLVDLNWNAASRNSPDRPAVALAGRIPVKVSNKNGNIEVGDPITSSDIPGVAMKATKSGQIIGKALESLNCEEVCEEKVLVFVNISWFDPDAYLTETGDLRIKGFEQVAEDGTIINTIYKIVRVAINGTEEIIEKIGVFKTVGTQELATNIISPVGNSDLIIDLDPNNSTSSAKLAIKGENDEEVASIDALGNAQFDGEITANDLIIENNATVSGTLYADDIRSTKIEEIEKLLKDVEENQELLASSLSWNVESASDSANINLEDVEFNDLYVTGIAAINNLTLSNSFSLGSDFVFQAIDNSINTLTSPLRIQSLAMSNLEIMNGKITIDTNGDTKFLGNVEIAGNLDVKGTTNIKNAVLENFVIATDISTATEEAEIIEGQIVSNSIAGKAILPANAENIRINNNKVSQNTLIYITPISSTENKVLFVESKGQGFFEVGFSDTLDSDVEFNWWIIELGKTTSQTLTEETNE